MTIKSFLEEYSSAIDQKNTAELLASVLNYIKGNDEIKTTETEHTNDKNKVIKRYILVDENQKQITINTNFTDTLDSTKLSKTFKELLEEPKNIITDYFKLSEPLYSTSNNLKSVNINDFIKYCINCASMTKDYSDLLIAFIEDDELKEQLKKYEPTQSNTDCVLPNLSNLEKCLKLDEIKCRLNASWQQIKTLLKTLNVNNSVPDGGNDNYIGNNNELPSVPDGGNDNYIGNNNELPSVPDGGNDNYIGKESFNLIFNSLLGQDALTNTKDCKISKLFDPVYTNLLKATLDGQKQSILKATLDGQKQSILKNYSHQKDLQNIYQYNKLLDISLKPQNALAINYWTMSIESILGEYVTIIKKQDTLSAEDAKIIDFDIKLRCVRNKNRHSDYDIRGTDSALDMVFYSLNKLLEINAAPSLIGLDTDTTIQLTNDTETKEESSEEIDQNESSNGLLLDSVEDNNPWMGYTKKAIDEILPLRLEVLDSDVDYVIPRYVLHNSDVSAKQISQEICQNVFKKSEGATSAVLNLDSRHWVSMVIDQAQSGIKVHYMDSEKQPISSIFKKQLIKDLQEISVSNVEFIEQDVQKQKYNNCGPESIENIVRLFDQQQFIDQDNVLDVHSNLYETKLYEDFNQTNEFLLLE
ncbi:MAG: hypothetical protein DGJ47_000646 [Rickettsiaceae bacterium]